MSDLWAALALVAVLEGLVLLAFPGLWKRAAHELLTMPEGRLRRLGAVILGAGLLALYLVRG
jgi:uncharacterized protein YjeT (DUF2065 family)